MVIFTTSCTCQSVMVAVPAGVLLRASAVTQFPSRVNAGAVVIGSPPGVCVLAWMSFLGTRLLFRTAFEGRLGSVRPVLRFLPFSP